MNICIREHFSIPMNFWSWVKSFTGRILDIQGTCEPAILKVTRDWERMYQMYCSEEKEETNGTV